MTRNLDKEKSWPLLKKKNTFFVCVLNKMDCGSLRKAGGDLETEIVAWKCCVLADIKSSKALVMEL